MKKYGVISIYYDDNNIQQFNMYEKLYRSKNKAEKKKAELLHQKFETLNNGDEYFYFFDEDTIYIGCLKSSSYASLVKFYVKEWNL